MAQPDRERRDPESYRIPNSRKPPREVVMARLTTLAPRLRPLDTRTARPALKRADPELLTTEHRGWADEVKKRAGFRCEDCGATGVKLYADHVRERRDGGARLDPANGRCRCGPCHGRKTARERAKRMGERLDA